jgi:hypothetical protein
MSRVVGSDNGLAVRLFFQKVNPNDNTCRAYKCKICDIKRQKNLSGYTNLIDHLNEKHKKWKRVVEQAKSSKKVVGSMDKFLKKGVDPKYKNIFRWLDWIIKGKLPFNFIESPLTRKNTKL